MLPPTTMVGVLQRFGGEHAVKGHALARRAGRMTCDVQMGPALHEGEIVMGALDYEFSALGRARGVHATLLISDRRIFGSISTSDINATVIDLPLSQVMEIRTEGEACVAVTPHGVVRFPMYGEQVFDHLQNTLALPEQKRTLGPLILEPAHGDPIAAHAASVLLLTGHPVTVALPQLAFEATRQGQLDYDQARAILERAVILDRSLSMGRAMHQGQWLSMLPRLALRSVLVDLFGQPLQATGGIGWERDEFALEHASVGLPVSGLDVRLLSATLTDLPCGCGLLLATAKGSQIYRLPFAATTLLQSMFRTIARAEVRHLLAEVALVGRLPPEQLLSASREALEAGVALLGTPLDLAGL